MKLIEAKEQLIKLKLPALTLQDVVGYLQLDKTQASRLMRQLVEVESIIKLKRGIWAWPNSDPLALISFLTSPFPSYISLQSALFYHGVIEQIPAIYYAVSMGRKRLEHTPVGVFSIHHINTSFFMGFETHYNPYYQLASPEKAFLDYLYLGRVEPSLFGKLPEIDKTKLKITKLKTLLKLITHSGTQTYLSQKLDGLF